MLNESGRWKKTFHSFKGFPYSWCCCLFLYSWLKYFEEFYYDDVSENHDIYFTEDDYELSDEQESYKLKLEEHKEKLEALKTEYEDK